MTDAGQDDEPIEVQYGLVMPFVVCVTEGGSYDDRSFVAGARWAILNQRMSLGESVELREYVPPELVPQVDLSAMQHGYTLTSEPWEEFPDEWWLVTLVKQVV